MSYKVEILETNNKLEISSSVNEQAPNIEIIQEASPSINVVHSVSLLPSDFNDNIESVIKSFLRSGYGVSLFPSGNYLLVQTSGLQPSGNYSLNGHSHSSLDITNFNSSVSGLLPVKNIVSGSGISIVNNNDVFTVSVTGQFGLTAEQVDDKVNSLLVAGTGISLSYDDFNDRLTISTVGLQPSGHYSLVGHGHTISDISNLQNTLDNKASLMHSHSAEAIVSGTLDFNRLPFTVTYPVRAVHIGGIISFNNWAHTISPTYYLNGSLGDMQTIAVMNFPATSVYIDVSQSVTKYLNDNPGRTFTYASLEIVLVDAANRIVGWGTTASIPAVNPSNGTAGTSMTINLLSFPSVPNNWVIGGLPTSGTNTVDILPITAYKKVASRWLDIEKHDWNNIVNPPSTFSPSSHTHGNITNIGTIGTQTNQILITSTSGLITTTSDLPSSQIRDFNTSVSGLISGIYAPLHSPALSGVPTAPTANSGNSSSQIANTQFVRNEISNLVNSAPNTLDTLNELASALGNDPNFATTVASGLGSKASLSGANFLGNITAPSGDFIVLRQNGTLVSTSGHKHSTNDILDFNSSVSGLLPIKDVLGGNNITITSNSGQFTISVTGQLGLTAEQVDDRVSGLLSAGNYVNLNYSDENNLLTISVTGLQPSGNYSLFGHTHSYTDITNFASGIGENVSTLLVAGNNINLIYNEQVDTLTISTTGLQPVGNYSVVGHTHTSSNITDFNSSVSGLLPVRNLLGSGNINVLNSGGFFTVSVTGLQPSGNYSLVGHTHTASNITNFDSSVSGLISGIYAPLNSPAFIGIPIAPTAASGTNNTQIANTQFVRTEISNLINAAPSTLDTLNELATALGNDPNFATTISNSLGQKANLNGATFTGVISGPSGNFTVLQQNGVGVSVTGHTHNSTNITDFNTSVSGLLPVTNITGNSGIVINKSGTSYNVSSSGLAYLSGANFSGSISAPSGSFNNIKINLGSLENPGISFNDNPGKIYEGSSSAIIVSVNGNTKAIEIVDGVTVFHDTVNMLNDLRVYQGSPSLPSITSDYDLGTGFNFPADQFGTNAGVIDAYSVENHCFRVSPGGNFSVGTTVPFGRFHVSGVSNFSGPIFASSGNFNSNLRVNNVPVSVSGHTHVLSSITDAGTAASRNAPSTGNAGLTEVVLGNDTRLSDQRVPTDGSVTAEKIAANQQFNLRRITLDERLGIERTAPSTNAVLWVDNPNRVFSVTANGAMESTSLQILNSTTFNLVFGISTQGIVSAGTWQGSAIAVAYGGTGATTTEDARTNLGVSYGSTSGTVCQGNDSRLSDARFPTAHKSTHATGGADALTPTDIGAANASHTHTSSNITDFNSSVSGLLPVKDINSGTYVNITNNSGVYTVNSTGEANLLETTVFNKTGSQIPKLSVVYINGGQGDQPTIALASASGEAASSKTYGITAENIDNMSSGKVIVAGALTSVNTDQFNPTAPNGDINGTTLWLSPTVAGGLTTTKPSAPYHMVSVGTVVRTHQNEGVIEVRIQNGFELEELHNVAISGLANNQFIKYDSSTSLWKNVTAIASDISDFNSSVSGLLPVTNIVGGTNISVVPSGSVYTVSVSGSLGLTTEEVDDRVSNLLVAGSGISLNYNDNSNTLTINNTSISPDEIEEYVAFTNLPASGNINILYRTTDDGRIYQWSGSVYAEIGPDSVTTGSHAFQHYTNGIDPILNVVSRPATLTATVNNYAHNNADIIYLNADADRIITGLVSATDGTVKLLINSSLFTITLDHQDTNSNPENRFIVPFGSDYVLQPGYSITIVYDSNALRWRILA